VTSPLPTLALLAYHWGDAYLFSSVRDRWVALRRDARYFLTADSLAELEILVTTDHRDNPVSRAYDPPREADYLAIPGFINFPNDGYADDDEGLDEETLIVLWELRRTFPAWRIIYSAEMTTWVGRTRAGTICQRSPLSLAIALTLIQHRRGQRSAEADEGNPAPGDGPTS
jgi:hypothetical protein